MLPPPRFPRELVPRVRVEALRGRAARAGFAALPVERLAPALADFARLDDALLVAVARFAVDFLAAGLRALDLRAPLLADVEPELPPLLAAPSKLHLPDITRCAASATASAMIEPSLVALDIMLVAAADAVSAASSPASRIFLRAAGLAAIAAAAAVSPAASISLLIAALASLSIVSLDLARDEDELEVEPVVFDPEERPPEELEREELLRVGFAIVYLPASLKKHFTAVSVP